MAICAVCKQKVDLKRRHVFFRKQKKDGSFSKNKTYEHCECSDLIFDDVTPLKTLFFVGCDQS